MSKRRDQHPSEQATRPEVTQGRALDDSPPFVPDHEVIKRIGRGSYGEVWLARNATGSYRAVKVVYRATFDGDRPYEREFTGIKEFEPISRSHPSQVDILHVGRNEQAGYFYYVMELADDANVVSGNQCSVISSKSSEGTPLKTDYCSLNTSSLSGTATATLRIDPETYEPATLRTMLREQGRLPVSECLNIAAALAEALQHLHAHGLVHRDIKPSNIIFVNGRPKLADIGLVARADATLSFVGTEGYLPPEGPGKPQADIYSFGKVLYEMASGKDRNQFPEPPTLLKELPDRAAFLELNEVILKACAHNATERYQSAAEMQAELVSLRAGKSLKRSRLMEKRLAQLTRLSAVGLVVTALLVAGYFYQQRQTQKANRLAAELQITHGLTVMDQGDLSGSLLWFVKAFEQARWTKEEIEMHRLRLGAVLRDCPKLVQLFVHERGAGRLGFSADGRRVLTYFYTPNVQIFDVATGEPIAVLRHSNQVWHAAFSTDGTRVVTLSGSYDAEDKEVRVWDVSTGQPIGPPISHSAHSQRVITGNNGGGTEIWDALSGAKLGPNLNHNPRVAFSRDGRGVITVGRDKTVQVWNADSGEPNGPAFRQSLNGALLGVSSDGHSALTARGQTAYLWDIRTGEPLLSPLDHTGGILLGKFSSAGDKILTIAIGFEGSFIQVWNAISGEKYPRPNNKNGVADADFSPDGQRVVVGGESGLAQVFEVSTGTTISAPVRQNGTVWGVQFHPDGRHIATANVEPLVRVWEITSARLAGPVLKHTNHATWAGFSPDGLRILTASADGMARLWDAATGTEMIPALEHRGFLIYGWPSFSRDGKRVLTASDDHVVELWDAATGKPLAQALRHHARVRHAELSPDGKLVVTTTEAGAVQLWDAHTGAPVGPVIPRLTWDTVASFSPDGRRLATIGRVGDTSVRAEIWDVTTGQPLTPPMLAGVSPGCGVSFSPDGGRLLTRTYNGEVRVWDAHSGQPITPVLPHDVSPITSACFSPDGRRVLTAWGHGARLWDAATAKQLTRPLEHERGVSHAAFSPDGRRIVTASGDHTARIWDASTGLPLTPPLRHQDAVNCAEFSPDGRRVITASDDGTARVWEFEPATWPVEDLRLLAQLLSGRTIDATGSFESLSPETLKETLRKLKTRLPEYFQEGQKPPR